MTDTRSAAKKQLGMEEYRQQMHDIYSTSVCESTIDEAPMAYKSAEEIEELIGRHRDRGEAHQADIQL